MKGGRSANGVRTVRPSNSNLHQRGCFSGWADGLNGGTGLSGESITFDWMKRRIQPLQARVTFGFEYQGKNDPSCCSEEEISNGEALRRVQRLFEEVEHVLHLLNTYSVLNPPKVVSVK